MVGTLCLLAVVGALVRSAVDLRAVLVPGWSGLEARLVEVVLGTSALVVLAQLLGWASQLRRPALVLGALLLAGAAALARRRAGASGRAEPGARLPPPSLRGVRIRTVVAAGAVALVTAQWLAGVRASLRTGVQSVDALHYHLTYAAHFAQDGSIRALQRLDGIGVTTWYPLDDELVHAVGMVLLGSDALSPVLGLLHLPALLLAVAVLARPYAAVAPAVAAACVALAVLGPDYAGSAANDWAATWPLVAGLALLGAAAGRPEPLPLPVVALTGLAGGLAAGTKLTALAPALALLVGVVVVARGRRPAALGVSLAGHALTGGGWYVRNLLVVGNPVPATDLGIGPFRLPRPAMPVLDEGSASVLSYATDLGVVRGYFVPGLRSFLGPAWPLLLLVVAAGLLAGLSALRGRTASTAAGHGGRRLLGITALVGSASAAAYLVTPTGAAGADGAPVLFVFNIRYAVLALLLGLVLAAVLLTRRGLGAAATLGAAGLLLITVLRAPAWSAGWPWTGLATALGLLVLGAGCSTLARRPGAVRALVAVALLAAVVAAPAAVRTYEDGRYGGAAGPRDELFAALAGARGERIGVVGFPLQYPFFGPRLDNEVVYLGQRGAGESFSELADCAAFRRAARGLDHVVVLPFAGLPVPEALEWARSDPAARTVAETAAGTVLRLDGDLDPTTCPGGTS